MPRRDAMQMAIGEGNVYVARREVIDLVAAHSARDLKHFTDELAHLQASGLVERVEDAELAELQRLAELHQRALTATLGLIATRDPAEAFDVSGVPREPDDRQLRRYQHG